MLASVTESPVLKGMVLLRIDLASCWQLFLCIIVFGCGLCGLFIPIRLFPFAFQSIVHFLPYFGYRDGLWWVIGIFLSYG